MTPSSSARPHPRSGSPARPTLPLPRPASRLAALLAGVVAGTALLPTPSSGQAVTLGQAADSALAHHPSVGAARAAVEGSEANVRGASAARLPSLAASSQATRFEEPMVVAPLHGFDPTAPPDFDRTLIQSRLGLEYTVFDGGARGAAVRAARNGAGAAAARLDDARAGLLEGTVAAYLGVASAREVRDAAERRVTALAAEASRARQSLAEGTAARVEVLRAEAALLDARAAEATASAAVDVAEGRLARLTGAAPAAVAGWRLQVPAVDPEDVLRPSPAGTPSPDAVDPRVVAAERAVAAAEARLDRERSALLPSLRGSAGLVNYASGAGDFITEWQAGVQLSWPVFTGGARGAAIDGARAAVTRAREELRLARLEEADARDAARADLVEAATRTAALAAAVEQWTEVARIEALRLASGAGTQPDLLQAEAGLFQARAGLARARNATVLARVRLARAQGILTRSWLDTTLEAQP